MDYPLNNGAIESTSSGIRILAPMIGIRRKKDEEAEKDIGLRIRRFWLDSAPPMSLM